MTTFERLRRHRPATWTILVLLMVVLPLQGLVACALGLAGPLHTHRAVAQVMLEDVRRPQIHVREREVHVATAFGHFHAGGGAARHNHRADDMSVVIADDGGAGGPQDANGSTLDHAATSMTGLLLSHAPWIFPEHSQVRPPHTAWSWLTFEPAPFERPPRST